MRFTFSEGYTLKTGGFFKYSQKYRFKLLIEYELSVLIFSRVALLITHFLNHINLFDFVTDLLTQIKSNPQFLHLNRCLLF